MDPVQVPLVIYRSGVRHEIGKAIVKGDGSIEGQVSKDHVEIFREVYGPTIGAISIDPTLKRNPTTIYENVDTILHPKIQE